MGVDILLALAAVFVAVALTIGSAVAAGLGRLAPGRRRLEELAVVGGPKGGAVAVDFHIEDRIDPRYKSLSRLVPKSPKEMGRLRRRLARAGYTKPEAAIVYTLCEFGCPVLFGGIALLALGMPIGLLPAALAAIVGYALPGLYVGHKTAKRQRQIQNGLADALDLMIVCIEAGSSLDQSLVKASEELHLTYPALAEEFNLINLEIRAGKRRLEAFKNFAARTKLDDVRALVAMLVQTDRFGTSVAQALRTQADTLRTRRRQRAEEKAAKLGVKLVFPLVFFLFPALYAVLLGPGAIQIFRVLIQQVANNR
jgi:tight adherence protein C